MKARATLFTMYFLAAGWKPFNILYITKYLTYNISRKQISIARYYIYRMKATVLIIFILVAQVFADFHSIGFDGVDPDAYEASIDSMPFIADSVTKLFSLPDSSLIQAASDFYSFKMVFNPIRDSLILFYTEHPEEPLDSLRQEVLLNWSCRHLLHVTNIPSTPPSTRRTIVKDSYMTPFSRQSILVSM